ncbi:MAG TPA: NAD(P)H-hydrate dehydratase [Roseateles sp.]|nr:NAD(P)H-hydrate dehydratase [Roseateles sp.]
MRRVLHAPENLPLHGLAASRAWEAEALARSAPQALMQRAGLAVAKLALALKPDARRIALLCGPGNNGGDALVAAQALAEAGKRAALWLCPGAGTAPPDAAWALRQTLDGGLAPQATLPDALQADLVIDGLLGLGANRAPEGWIADAIRLINAQPAPVLAIDLPSGLDGQHGRAGLAVHADHTLSLLTLKPGLFTAQGRALAGEIWWDALEQPCPAPPDAWLQGPQALADWRSLSGARGHASHKGRWGDVLVVGGQPGMRGAAWLAARAALAAGAGRVYACLLQGPAGDNPPQDRPELMSWPEALLQQPEHWARHTVVAGCGGGQAIAAALPSLLAHAHRLVLDADALNALAADAALRRLLQARQTQGCPTLLTPHPLEAARLLGGDSGSVQADRLGAARALARELGCTVLLKGSGTVIASPGLTPAINASGNAALATAGTGDVLAGWLGGLWAQYGGDGPVAPHRLGCAGAYWHGRAAEPAQGGSLRAADLIERMHALHAA